MTTVINGTTGITTDGLVTPALTYNGSTAPGLFQDENRIINGSFDFWQRGTTQTADGYGSADRWRNTLSGGTVTQSRQSFTVGDTLGSNNPTFFLRQSVSGQSLTTHYAIVRQLIEGVRSYAGQTITVLGWARRSSGTGNMVVSAEQFFGTGGSPSAPVPAISPTTVTLTGSWASFAATLTIPSITGKTIGTDGNDSVVLNFWTSAGSNFNSSTNSLGLQTIGVDLWGIHIKVGTHTTAATSLYRAPELGPELARCQRYYERAAADAVNVPYGPGYRFNATQFQALFLFKTVKRALPGFSSSAASSFFVQGNGNVTPTTITLSNAATHSVVLSLAVPSGSAGDGGSLIDQTGASFLAFDAEL